MQARANMGAAALAPVLSETMARLRSIHEARIKTSVHSIGERLRLREARAEGELTGGGTNPMRRGFWAPSQPQRSSLLAAEREHGEDRREPAALTGSFVSAGNTMHNAVKLAVKQINDAGGFVVNGKTYKLEPYYRDDRTDVNAAIARELVDHIGVA